MKTWRWFPVRRNPYVTSGSLPPPPTSCGAEAMAACRGSSSTKWFLTREQLDNTPSRRCGVEPDRELSYRQQAATLIQDMGQRLNVYPLINKPQAASATTAAATNGALVSTLSVHGRAFIRKGMVVSVRLLFNCIVRLGLPLLYLPRLFYWPCLWLVSAGPSRHASATAATACII